jgi:hypothetical protein
MKKTILVFTLSSALLLNSFSLAFAKAPMGGSTAAPKGAKTYTGYLMDSKCFTKGLDDETGKINVKKNPQKHLATCLNMQECMDSGLGISVKVGTAYKFYKFDKKGSKMADDNIMMDTTKTFNFKITATGVMNGNTITLASIK